MRYIKFLFPVLLTIFGNVSSNYIDNENFQFDYQLSICAIFQNEARFLKEWIEFHHMLGIEHFYLYNNLSDDEYLEILTPYINMGIVELVDWPYNYTYPKEWPPIQNAAYMDCIKNRALNKTNWLALIDTDEFIVPTEHENICELLKDYINYAGLCINWQMYGTSEVERIKDDQLLIEQLVYKADEQHIENKHVKSIVHPHLVTYIDSVHTCNFYEGFYAVNEHGERFSGQRPILYLYNKGVNQSNYISIDLVRINHYWCRDKDFFLNNKIKRRVKFGLPTNKCIEWGKSFNTVYDPIAQRFVPKLKKIMNIGS